MNLENQVCSLELSKRLKELGVKQSSLFFYWKEDIYYKSNLDTSDIKLISAFTVAELGEILIECDFRKNLELDYYTTDIFNIALKQNKSINFESIYIKDKNEANARARMVIYLIEQGLLNDTGISKHT